MHGLTEKGIPMPASQTRMTLIIAGLALMTSALLPVETVEAAEPGAPIYKAKCVACHAADGSGNTTYGKKEKLRDLRDPEVQKQTGLELTKVIAGGKGKMPGYGKQLSTQQIQDLIAHIRTLKK